MRKRAQNHTRRGFTLVELMVTVAVVAILAAVAVPGMQSFLAKSGMNAVKDDFAIALQRARLDAINRNTCVSICQLAAEGGNTCATGTALGNWHRGWITYTNAACGGTAATALTADEVISVRQPGNGRYQLVDVNTAKQDVLTFDARGTLVSGQSTYRVVDGKDANSPYRRDITVSFQGRVQVDTVKDVATTSSGSGNTPPVAANNP
ncbi:type IV fimbrial biogenesis protein FimT [Aquabacterium commune]|uniref:Type II secretion system protein H n=1 Tax=Aquabacterium commune TaxID=70586 RepID=A0A4R6RHR1_9BURK|nr:GspH/FimT family pseudopilin [Aquabacterium commune]TDP85989.1 type IV fimbrial biogenesis protein FimT [Aquabacterium commune]